MVKIYKDYTIVDKKSFLETSIIRLDQLQDKQKNIAKDIKETKEDIFSLLSEIYNDVSYSFENEKWAVSLQIVEKTSTKIDNDRLKEDNLYDQYKTKETSSRTFHITKKDIS